MKIGITDPQGRVRFSLRFLLEQQGWTVSDEAGQITSREKLSSAILWGLVFSLYNGFLKELWLRAAYDI